MANTPVRQYIGARYVPMFADPIQWNNTKTYEPLTIVYNNGNSYTSRQFVPTGIDITNTEYWALTGNYNAQIEQYRQEVKQYDERINNAQSLATTNKEDIAAIDANLNALHANNIENATNLYNTITRDQLITFGDSWTYHVNNALPHGIAKALSATLIKQYGVSGAFFSNNPNLNSILAQVNTAKADNTYDKNLITKIVIICGANNVNSNITPTGISETIKEIQSTFPNAKIYWAPSFCLKFNNAKQMNYYSTITHELAHRTACTPLNNLFCDLFSNNFDIFQDDNLHLIDNEYTWNLYGYLIGNEIKGTQGLIQNNLDPAMYFNGSISTKYDQSDERNTVQFENITGNVSITPYSTIVNININNITWKNTATSTDEFNLYIKLQDTPRTIGKSISDLIPCNVAVPYKYPYTINARMDNNALHISSSAKKENAMDYKIIYLNTIYNPLIFIR